MNLVALVLGHALDTAFMAIAAVVDQRFPATRTLAAWVVFRTKPTLYVTSHLQATKLA
jgi:hypothetical protein